MSFIKNIAQDYKIEYKVNVYEKIEKLFSKDNIPSLHFMLALMGFRSGNKIDLEKKDSNGTHDLSLRTLYPKNESDYDAYIGLISILDNTDLTYDEVINEIAFERTETKGTPFLKMKNVKTFFEYMLGGLEYFEKTFLSYSKEPVDIVDEIHEFLEDENMKVEEILIELLLKEGQEIDG